MRTTPIRRSESSDFSGSRVLVTGAGGMLGWDLAAVFRETLGESAVTALDRRGLDVTDEKAMARELDRVGPGLVLNAAAYTNVDKAEYERDEAYRGNVEGPRCLAKLCSERGIRLVHFGTDQVFSGERDRPVTEEDVPQPVNHYAETKLLGEREVLKAPGALVLRVQWLYGKRKDRFTPIRALTTFSPFTDQFGAPAWSREIARYVSALVERKAAGIFHFAYDDWASWADVYSYVLQKTGWPVTLAPRPTAEAQLAARRPRFSVLSNAKLARFLGEPGLGSWKLPLERFLAENR